MCARVAVTEQCVPELHNVHWGCEAYARVMEGAGNGNLLETCDRSAAKSGTEELRTLHETRKSPILQNSRPPLVIITAFTLVTIDDDPSESWRGRRE